ncbi:CPBP family intramembrane metalloprotease [Sphingomonas lutea]|uniref:CPBP family intramembrane metalloprotease n=1 Tax=Sphingomonas lutea TaxID=1045317 RepID=A0A7G9SKK3_9SPHN|nr:type II CAAX endopeptidase family protein [Sphingomonas lutea]QNN68378.1 CPBP family intramembrane metalloprotease [Sphingomonas lutea]
MHDDSDEDDFRPNWHKIADFPLVTLLIATTLFALALGGGILAGRALPPMDPLLSLVIQSLVTITLAMIVYKVVIAHIGFIHKDELRFDGALRETGIGLAFGAGLFTLIVALAALLDVYNIIGMGSARQLPNILLATTIVPAVMEEMFFRGILFRWVEEFTGSWAALVLTSALFGLAHIGNDNATWFSSFAIAVEAGVLLGGAYMLTRSLWMPIGLHAAWNFTQGFIFDVPVSGIDSQGIVEARLSGPELLSGGQFGLEASILALLVATAAGVWLIRRAMLEDRLVEPWWVRRRRSQEAVRIDVDADAGL